MTNLDDKLEDIIGEVVRNAHGPAIGGDYDEYEYHVNWAIKQIKKAFADEYDLNAKNPAAGL